MQLNQTQLFIQGLGLAMFHFAATFILGLMSGLGNGGQVVKVLTVILTFPLSLMNLPTLPFWDGFSGAYLVWYGVLV